MKTNGGSTTRRVVLLEYNEITHSVLDPLIAAGKLPSFARMKREGTWAAPDAVERPPNLDPWTTWVTVHSGVPSSQHGSFVLGQDPSTISAKLTWDYALEAGKSIGIFGSMGVEPRAVPGFIIPGPFAATNATFPPYLSPIQAVNRAQTQVHQKNAPDEGLVGLAKRSVQLLDLGLSPSTCARAAWQLAREKVDPSSRWQRACLQPLVNYDFFARAFQRYQPDFSTWHTNHCAHFMHHYWRAWDDSKFPVRADADEKRVYGRAIELGYQIADRILGRFMRLVDRDTVLVLASSMGQQPFVSELYKDGKVIVRFKDFPSFLRLAGIERATDVVPTMVPQWNLRVTDMLERKRAVDRLRAIRCFGGTFEHPIVVEEHGEMLTVTPLGLAERSDDIRYHFDPSAGARADGYRMEELFATDAPTPKEGCHHPTGVLMIWGEGIARGTFIDGTTNLDIAPTVLRLLGLQVPELMTGRSLLEPTRSSVTKSPQDLRAPTADAQARA